MRGDRIASGLPLFPVHAGARELGIRCHRGETLVDAIHAESEARRELPIEPTYTGARLAVARDLNIVLSRADDGKLNLTTEAGGA